MVRQNLDGLNMDRRRLLIWSSLLKNTNTVISTSYSFVRGTVLRDVRSALARAEQRGRPGDQTLAKCLMERHSTLLLGIIMDFSSNVKYAVQPSVKNIGGSL
jgi:hypothetical protein